MSDKYKFLRQQILIHTETVLATSENLLKQQINNLKEFGWGWDGKISYIKTVQGTIYGASLVSTTAARHADSPRMILDGAGD